MERNSHPKSNTTPRMICQSLLLIFATTISACSAPQKTARRPSGIPAPAIEISIIPAPASIILTNGHFEFTRDTRIIAADQSGVKASNSLNNMLLERYGFTLQVTPDRTSQDTITFSTASAGHDQSGGGEGYSLNIKPGAIQITGSERGMFYAIQSLLQLFPIDFRGEANITAADITDAPRFRYRGMHLDVSRHFMPIEFVKKFIRLLSRYKYNYFHWHLTDDQGWRIEIKKYPLLTVIGSRRSETKVGKSKAYIGDNIPVDGFYTQEEIRDVVEYAKARYVTIVPEIELPGHSSAALASYPNLGCGNKNPYGVKTTWGAFRDIYCPKESTFQFLEDVLGEVIGLFANSPYIHIGGDEVLKGSWSRKDLQDLKRANNLSSEKEVQSWFVKRIGSYVNSKGKQIIAWDDMVNVGLPHNATVMYWRDSPAARRNTEVARRTVSNAVIAARKKHEVIMTPDTFTYFDHPQGHPAREPLSLYSTQIRLDKVYNFEPVPAELSQEEAKYIIGAQGCIWTEYVKTPKNVEYMMFPRALALAEVLWSKQGNKDFSGFYKRLRKELPNFDREQVNYRRPEPHSFDVRQDVRTKPRSRVPSRGNEVSPR